MFVISFLLFVLYSISWMIFYDCAHGMLAQSLLCIFSQRRKKLKGHIQLQGPCLAPALKGPSPNPKAHL